MNENTMYELLDEVRVLVASYRAENYKNGKEFNVFHIQRTASDEVRVCRMIRELLDPCGSHGQGIAFLKPFVEGVLKIDSDGFSDNDYKNAKIICEEVINDSRRIDIVLRISDRFFPIEVKVYAYDQDKQCRDYYDYAVNLDPNTCIYYLTLDGHEPSDESKGELTEEQYKCISFSEQILSWLDKCIYSKEIEQIYSVREILIQFRNSIRELTGNQSEVLNMQIKDKITASYDTFAAAVEIEKALLDAKIDKMNEVFSVIKQHMEKLGFNNCYESFQEESKLFYRNGKKSWPSLNYVMQVDDPELYGKIVLRFEIEQKLYFGICPWSGKNNWDEKKNDKSQEYVNNHLFPEEIKANGQASTWYWWKYLNPGNEVDFRTCNSEYLRLFDKSGFDDYMRPVIENIDKAVELIKAK